MRDGVLYHKAFTTSYSFADFLPDSWLLLADSFRAAMRALDLPQFAAAFTGTSPVTMSRARPPPGTLVGLRSNVLGVRGLLVVGPEILLVQELRPPRLLTYLASCLCKC